MSSPSSADPVQIQARNFAGLFLLSLATLLLELALTRILSVSLWYHFGFLVISTALLGFGVSGVTLALWADLRERSEEHTSELQSRLHLVCRLLLEKKKTRPIHPAIATIDRRLEGDTPPIHSVSLPRP